MRTNSNSEGTITAIGGAVEAVLIGSLLSVVYSAVGTGGLYFLVVPALGLVAGIHKRGQAAKEEGSCLFLATMWLLLASNFIGFIWFVGAHSGGV